LVSLKGLPLSYTKIDARMATPASRWEKQKTVNPTSIKMTARPAPYCSNWPYFEEWRRWDYNRCECDYLYDSGEMAVEWKEDGGYEAFDQTYLCDYCHGRLHASQSVNITRSLTLQQAFLKSGAASYTYFLDHLPMPVAKELYGKYVWQEQTATIKRLMDAVEAATGDKVPAVTTLCDYLTTQRPFLSVNDGFRTATKEKMTGHKCATELLALIADIEAHP